MLLILGALAVLALGAGVAIEQHWLSLAALAPALYLLPCALMMAMCLRSGDNQRN